MLMTDVFVRSMQLLERASAWVKLAGCQDTVHFHIANATVSLHSMLSSYPGPIDLITIQVSTQLAVPVMRSGCRTMPAYLNAGVSSMCAQSIYSPGAICHLPTVYFIINTA